MFYKWLTNGNGLLQILLQLIFIYTEFLVNEMCLNFDNIITKKRNEISSHFVVWVTKCWHDDNTVDGSVNLSMQRMKGERDGDKRARERITFPCINDIINCWRSTYPSIYKLCVQYEFVSTLTFMSRCHLNDIQFSFIFNFKRWSVVLFDESDDVQSEFGCD